MMGREYETLMNILNQWNGVHIKLSPVVTILLGPTKVIALDRENNSRPHYGY